MKKFLLLAILLIVSVFSFAQDEEYDRTDFKGQVISMLTVLDNELAASKNESKAETIIVFDSKSIKIKDDVYEIVSKEFDGIDVNSFLCTKRGSNYTLTYIVDDYISIFDNSNPAKVTYFKELSE